jgi:hypothetical protein
MYETWDVQKRIAEATRVTARVVDHLQYLLDIHENNAVVLYSDTLSKQVPKSYAANAFNVFREAMHQIELVRVCALWDRGDIERESIMTVGYLLRQSADRISSRQSGDTAEITLHYDH